MVGKLPFPGKVWLGQRLLQIFVHLLVQPHPNSFLSRNQIQKVGVLDEESQG